MIMEKLRQGSRLCATLKERIVRRGDGLVVPLHDCFRKRAVLKKDGPICIKIHNIGPQRQGKRARVEESASKSCRCSRCNARQALGI